MRVTCYLVGAGPGDPSLITARGLDLIRRADAIVYDYLASDRLLDQAPAGADLVYVGKKGFGRHVSQDQINDLLVTKARELEARAEAAGGVGKPDGEGPVLVRLKGGDPYVFGRGGEETLALRAAGIPFEVVPGVTAGIAVPAYAGIPVTHRKLSSSVTLVTGHEDPTRTASSLDWPALAALVARGDTVCFYMGVHTLPQIARRLQEEGAPAQTPAALVRWGTTSDQETLVSTLAGLAQDAARARFAAPAIIVVGRTVDLRQELSWYEDLPLFGRTVVVTRSRTQAEGLVGRLRELGANVREVPAIAFEDPEDYGALDAGLGRLDAYDWIVFTSANGVKRFFDRLRKVFGRDARSLAGSLVAAIGPGTARALEAQGIMADLVPKDFRAEGMFEAMRDYCASHEGMTLRGARVLIPRAQVARDALPQLLSDAGAQVDVAAAYRTVVPGGGIADELRRALAAGRVDAVTFTSSSTVRNFCALLGADAASLMDGVAACSIGPITSQTLRDQGIEPAVEADRYTVEGLVAAIRGHYEA